MIGETIIKTTYLEFIDTTPSGRKTQIFLVRSVIHGNILGEVRWYGAWRQYAFFPRSGTVWNNECLQAVRGVISGLMEGRKNSGTS